MDIGENKAMVESTSIKRDDLKQKKAKEKDPLADNLTTIFSYESLSMATNNFTTRIGSNSMDGTLEDGTMVTVQRVSRGIWVFSKAYDTKFISFINMMSKIKHSNLVKVIGCCVENGQRYIVYESLVDSNRLSDCFRAKGLALTWPVRASICLGIALGLDYLHTKLSAAHCNIESRCVLIDDKLNPKISDFRFAVVRRNTSIGGGEYILQEQKSADVYNFGILVLEVITGTIINPILYPEVAHELVDAVLLLGASGKILDIVDPTLSEFDKDQVQHFLEVALSCVRNTWKLRPTMSAVLGMLVGGLGSKKKGGHGSKKKVLAKPTKFMQHTSHAFTSALKKEKSTPKGEASFQLKEKEDNIPENVTIFSYKSLQMATNDFTTIIGKSKGHYKGTLDNGSVVAVQVVRCGKWFSDSTEDMFISFVKKISRIQHPNVVAVIGYCVENEHRFIVYEFIDSLCLGDWFPAKIFMLSWHERASMCLGLARGLDYLHSYIGVVHASLTPGRILVDNYYIPKIADFRFAHLIASDPHYDNYSGSTVDNSEKHYLHHKSRTKSDVYEFGILLLEIITGGIMSLFSKDFSRNMDWLRQLSATGQLLKIVDPNLSDFPDDEVTKFIDIALTCAQEHPEGRPNMSEVLLMLLRGLRFSARISGQPGSGIGDIPFHVLAPRPKNKMTSNPEVTTISAVDPNVVAYELEAEEQPYRVENDIIMPNVSVESSSSGKNHEILKPGTVTSLTTQSDASVYNVETLGHSSQTIIREENEVVFVPRVNTKKPIERTVEKMLELFLDGRPRRICLCGKGGSGKTTVLKTLLLHPTTNAIFDQVVCVTVPRLAYREKIQSEIVRQLSLNVQNLNSKDELRFLIHQTLMHRKFLVLLDDVREIISLHEVGIPDPGSQNMCWVVLATRFPNVCQVFADEEIEMEVLSREECWEVFRRRVGDIVDSTEIQAYAQVIAAECHGVPLIISAVGSALKAETSVKEWRFALSKLTFSDTDTDDLHSFGSHVRYCYARLKTQELKFCFLYCALFPEEKEIDISMLVECFVNEGLLGGKTVAAFRKGYDIVGYLTNASLLEANDSGLVVKMHSLVRDAALSILSSGLEGCLTFGFSYPSPSAALKLNTDEDHFLRGANLAAKADEYNLQLPTIHRYLTRAGAGMKDPPSMEEWEESTMIFLMDNEYSSLPPNPSCPNLVALFLQRNSLLRMIPATFFNSMHTLRFLNLSKTRIKCLPDSFSCLKNLQVLLLRDCELLIMLPQSIGLLEALHVLDLQGTELSHLPDCVGKLANLKELRTSFYGSMYPSEYSMLPAKLLPDGVISSLDLRELGLFVYPGDPRWTSSALAVATEMSSLKLTSLSFHFPNLESLQCFVPGSRSWKQGTLSTFNLTVGHDFKHGISMVSPEVEFIYGAERCLRFVNGKDIPDAVVDVLKQATSFYLDHHLCISYLSQFGTNSLNSLKICILSNCSELLAIRQRQEKGAFLPVVEYLNINYLPKLERIFVGCDTVGSFARLRHLLIHACPKLRYIFTLPMLNVLPNLEKLTIDDCVSLRCIVGDDENMSYANTTDKTVPGDAVKEAKNSEPINSSKFPVLNNLKALKLHHLPELCYVWIPLPLWPPLEYISFHNCNKLRNLHMTKNDDKHIKEIEGDKFWWDLLVWDDPILFTRICRRFVQISVDNL